MTDALDFTDKARRARLRLIGIGVAVAVLVAGGGVLAVTTLDGGGGKGSSASPEPSKASGSPTPSAGPTKKWTPATAPRLHVRKGRSLKDGISVGFVRGQSGALSAAVRHLQELDILDDGFARKQMEAIVSPDSTQSVDSYVSEVRKTREGAGLPPSGHIPEGLSFTTQVRAARMTSADDTGDVVVVWMYYDRYASLPDKSADKNPLLGETTHAIYKWQDGDWKLTEESQYTKRVRGPRAYHPDSTYAWQDQWREVVVD
ncbi:hypothetical protein [Streptomyces triculaminicus]|uniref:hypothetical protein n=1 Tax=Streptomyces triculaminicus TaxID=2816232 RepID=UPI0037D20B14